MRIQALLLAVTTSVHLQAQATTPASAAPPPGHAAVVLARDVVWGVKGGLAAPGTAWVNDETEVDVDGGYSLSGFVDYRLGPKIMGTAAITLTALSNELADDQIRDFSAGLKAIVGGAEGAQFAFRPGFLLGYGSDGDATYMMMHTTVEMIPVRSAVPWVFEAGFVMAPLGGNDDYDFTLEPRLLIRFGRLF